MHKFHTHFFFKVYILVAKVCLYNLISNFEVVSSRPLSIDLKFHLPTLPNIGRQYYFKMHILSIFFQMLAMIYMSSAKSLF